MSDDRAAARFNELFGPEFGHGKSFDLAHLRAALSKLGDPHTKLPLVIHIAGTNGKGSTAAFLRAILEASGRRVHAFTKPHLFALNERFTLASNVLNDETLIAATERVAATGEDLTQFDAHVATALLLFAEHPADYAIVETGLGGRDDSTNVIPTPRVTVLTPIGFDHQDILGATLAEIAAHKAGIIKPGATVVTARQPDEARKVIEARAEACGATLLMCGRDWDAYREHDRLCVQTLDRFLDLPLPSLAGPHQIDNAGLATIAALTLNDQRIDDTAIAEGLTRARWPGRLQRVTSVPLAALAPDAELWIDGGHNVHAANALTRFLAERNRAQPRPTAAIVAMRARKDAPAFAAALSGELDLLAAITLVSEASADPRVVADAARCEAFVTDDLVAALKQIRATLEAPRVLICGSLALAAHALSAR